MTSTNQIFPQWLITIAIIATLVLLAILAYLPALNGSFVWDDSSWLWNSRSSTDPDGWYNCWLLTSENPDYWPLTATVFWVQWNVYERDILWGYHLLNLALHAISAVLLWRLLRRLKVPAPWLGAMLFVVHPACVPSVAWITELKNTLSMALFFLTLLLYARFDEAIQPPDTKPPSVTRRNSSLIWYIAAVVAFFLTLAAKTSTIMLPVLLLGLAWWRRNKISLKDILRTVPLFALSGLFAWTTIRFQHGHAMKGIPPEAVPANFFQRFCVAGKSFWFYLKSDIWPVDLSVIYTRWNIDQWNAQQLIWPVALLAVLILLLIYRRTWTRPILATIGYMAIVLFPVLGFFDMSFMHIAFVADHLQYLAIPAVMAFIAGTGWWLGCKSGIQGRAIVGLAGLVIIALFTYQSNTRSKSFRSERAIWADTVRINDKAWIAFNNLGMEDKRDGNHRMAIVRFTRAIELKPDYDKAYNNRGLAYAAIASGLRQARRIAESEQFAARAIADYDKALQIDPDYEKVYTNKGLVYQDKGDYKTAIHLHNKALEMAPNLGIALNNRGTAYYHTGQYDKAIADFTKAIASLLKYADAHHNRGLAYYKSGRMDEAFADFNQAIQYNPGRALAYHGRGLCYANKQMYDKAVGEFTATLRLIPTFVPTYEQRALAYLAMGQRQSAINDLETAVRINPTYEPVKRLLEEVKTSSNNPTD